MFKAATTKSRVCVTATVAALWLTACGGGGGGDDVAAAPSPAPAPAGAPAPGAPAPAPAPAVGTSFTATGPVDVWHFLSSSADGQLMVGGQAGLGAQAASSYLSVSTDGGTNWADNTAAGTGIWIASDVSADGNLIAAVQFQGGGVFTSVDRGTTFVQQALPVGLTGSVPFESVTVARLANGTNRIAAVVLDGPVIVGNVAADGTVSWLTPTTPAPVAEWRSIDSSADGSVMVAVAQDPLVYRSTDGGLTWTAVAPGVTDQAWYRVKVSDDGSTIAMAANSFRTSTLPGLPAGAGNGIYVSRNGGAFAAGAGAPAGEYTGIAMSADGGVIAATISNPNDPSVTGTGSVVLSRDGGANFAALPVTVNGAAVTETDFRSVAMSGDATRLAIAAGRFATSGTPGLGTGAIYVSTGSRPQ